MTKTHPSTVRVRFAPSPTGLQHVGGLRTALYNYLLAKKMGGQFLLRIEDTDQKRFVSGAVENILTFLHEFGLHYDEGPFLEATAPLPVTRTSLRYPGIVEHGAYGPYIQSERLEAYRVAAEELVEKGHAYYCFCSEERLRELRERQERDRLPPRYDRHCREWDQVAIDQALREGKKSVIRFRVPESGGKVTGVDFVRGEISADLTEVEDFVLLKSDGYPTYHLAVVVDDHAMGITHVFRGEEWIPSLPKHVLLYQAFGWNAPIFVHLSVILGADGKKKLSKRDGDVSVDAFVQAGYLREVLLNFVALLGWNPGQGSTREIFSLPELVQAFSLEHLSKSGAIFDRKKLDWMNHEYIARLSIPDLLARVRTLGQIEHAPWYVQASTERQGDEYLTKVLTVEQERLRTLAEVGVHNQFLFADTIDYAPTLLLWKGNTREATALELGRAFEILTNMDEADWTRERLTALLLEAAGDKRGDFLWPLRVALSGVDKSPSPMDIAWILGKESTLARITAALKRFQQPV